MKRPLDRCLKDIARSVEYSSPFVRVLNSCPRVKRDIQGHKQNKETTNTIKTMDSYNHLSTLDIIKNIIMLVVNNQEVNNQEDTYKPISSPHKNLICSNLKKTSETLKIKINLEPKTHHIHKRDTMDLQHIHSIHKRTLSTVLTPQQRLVLSLAILSLRLKVQTFLLARTLYLILRKLSPFQT
uniref:Uncharacterized protein n=1 Tax=Cacopsylla melanoneura TaxID=428564 RepID=A0A8D8RVD5_9HEMI